MFTRGLHPSPPMFWRQNTGLPAGVKSAIPFPDVSSLSTRFGMTTDQLSLSPQRELLYGNTGSSVQVLTLKPGQQYTTPMVPDMVQDWTIIEGRVKMNAGGKEKPLRAGRNGAHRRFLAGQPVIVENPSRRKPAKLVIISRFNRNSNAQTLPAKPVTETRPWGNFTVLADEPDYKLKELVVTPGGRLSLQRHFKRSEHWYILAGNPEVTQGQRKTIYEPGDYVRIRKGAWHRIDNRTGKENVVLIELQTGTYFGEDDIERKQDDYGRQ